MQSINDSFDYLAPLPLLPLVSVLAVLAGLILIFTRNMPSAHLPVRLGRITIWKTRA